MTFLPRSTLERLDQNLVRWVHRDGFHDRLKVKPPLATRPVELRIHEIGKGAERERRQAEVDAWWALTST